MCGYDVDSRRGADNKIQRMFVLAVRQLLHVVTARQLLRCLLAARQRRLKCKLLFVQSDKPPTVFSFNNDVD